LVASLRGCRGASVRVSLGSLAVLGLASLRLDAAPSTVYVLQDGGCMASCLFCSQGRAAPPGPREMLSRVRWPRVELGVLLDALRAGRERYGRVCLQSVLRPGFLGELLCLAEALAEAASPRPLSVTVTPVPLPVLRDLASRGVERLGVGLDAASPRVARAVRKPYPWSIYTRFIRDAVTVYGEGMVHVHLVAGLGETPSEMLEAMRTVYSLGARVALFRYTHLPGLPRLPGIDTRTYRFYQVARLMLEKGIDPARYAEPGPPPRFREPPPLTMRELEEALLTSGCPSCNRPFYNESPRGPIYNYPSRSLLESRRGEWLRDLEAIGALPRA